MIITILGSTRPMGENAVQLALSRGHSVKVLVRSGESKFKDNANVTIIKGDATKLDDLRSAVQGSDAVLSFLGAGNSNNKDHLPNARFAQAITQVLPPSVPLVTISNIGASLASREKQPWFYRRLLVPMMMGPILDDKKAMEEILAASALQKWVALRAAMLSDAPSDASKIRVITSETSADAKATKSTKRADIAVVALDLVEGKRDAGSIWRKAVAVISS